MAFTNNSENSRSHNFLISFCLIIMNLPKKIWGKVIEIYKLGKKLGKDDPRKIAHAFKVGLALTLVSLFYYFNPLYQGLGFNAIWAVLTVVVVFEFSVGATLGKGINRMWATFVAGALGLGCHRIATLSGRTGEPILIATFVFIIAFVVTYTRFFPRMKRRYDYGLLIFILTFSMVSVSGYRDAQVIRTAHMRVSTIIIGSCVSVLVCICICPVWIGEDLHNLVLGNIQKLGAFLEGFGNEYFKECEDVESENNDKSFLKNYKSALTSKTTEENMANLAKWEPGHGKFKFFHPWKQYLKIGNLSRECAYKIEALSNNLHSQFKSPKEIAKKFAEACTNVSTESGKALKEMAQATKKMQRSNKASRHIQNAKNEAEKLKALLKINKWEEASSLVDIVPVVTVSLLLLETIESIQNLEDSINELGDMVHFKTIAANNNNNPPQQQHQFHCAIVQPIPTPETTAMSLVVTTVPRE